MVYGFIFLEHLKTDAESQRRGILHFAKKHNLNIDEFVSFKTNPNMLMFSRGDTIICYAWNCLCKDMSFLRMFILQMLKNGVHMYSTTSKYHLDSSLDINVMQYAFSMYEDIRFNFLSAKAAAGASKRLIPGRHTGSKNKTHLLDGKEKQVWDMFNNGFSMYAISKKLKVSAPTIKKFLTSQN